MLFNKVSGGAEKVTIDGQKVDKKLDLERDWGLFFLPGQRKREYGRRMIAGCFQPIQKKYFTFDQQDIIYRLDKNDKFGDLTYDETWTSIRITEGGSTVGAFARKDKVIRVGSLGVLFSINENSFTKIGGNIGDTPNLVAYSEKTDELYGFTSKAVYKFDFKKNIWTEILSGNFDFWYNQYAVKDNKIYLFNRGAERKDILIFDNGNFTEIKNALPYKPSSALNLRVGILDGKFHIFGNFNIEDKKVYTNGSHFIEGDTIYSWNRCPKIAFSFDDYTSPIVANGKKLAVFSGYDDVECAEIVEIYKEREV